MLDCFALALAWELANDEIDEQPAPADVGGFVFPILRPFHKIFINVRGTFIEYDTGGDKGRRQYNPTGLLRVHIKGGHPELEPSDGTTPYLNGKDV